MRGTGLSSIHRKDTQTNEARHADGRFATSSFEALYTEIKRLDQLRALDQAAFVNAMSAAEKAVAAALVSTEKAVNKAEGAQQRVNETQNEFRGTLTDQAKTFMPRLESENTTRELREQIAGLGTEIKGLRSRVDLGPPSLSALQAGFDNRTGASRAIEQGWKYVLAIGSLLIGIAGLVMAVSQ
jgi:chromosome segregation ATPase